MSSARGWATWWQLIPVRKKTDRIPQEPTITQHLWHSSAERGQGPQDWARPISQGPPDLTTEVGGMWVRKKSHRPRVEVCRPLTAPSEQGAETGTTNLHSIVRQVANVNSVWWP